MPRGSGGPQGPAGAAGAKGENGTAGSNGKNGEPGQKGEQGPQGATGNTGANGKSVTVSGTASGCAEGGVTVEEESSSQPHEVCNGKNGGGGSGTLEQGKSEYGQFAEDRKEETGFKLVSISFPTPLPATVSAHFIGPEEGLGEPKESTDKTVIVNDCPGTYKDPVAKEGNFCAFAPKLEKAVYATGENGEQYFFVPEIAGSNELGPGFTDNEAGRLGVGLSMVSTEQIWSVAGTWAVTAG